MPSFPAFNPRDEPCAAGGLVWLKTPSGLCFLTTRLQPSGKFGVRAWQLGFPYSKRRDVLGTANLIDLCEICFRGNGALPQMPLALPHSLNHIVDEDTIFPPRSWFQHTSNNVNQSWIHSLKLAALIEAILLYFGSCNINRGCPGSPWSLESRSLSFNEDILGLLVMWTVYQKHFVGRRLRNGHRNRFKCTCSISCRPLLAPGALEFGQGEKAVRCKLHSLCLYFLIWMLPWLRERHLFAEQAVLTLMLFSVISHKPLRYHMFDRRIPP